MPSDSPASKPKWVYLFHEGEKSMRNLLGGKGAGVAEMTRAGMPVPPGFTITTEACLAYFDAGKTRPEGLDDQVRSALKRVEEAAGRVFGDAADPLLVSVRSGARVSMPGMMDTVLNLGINANTLVGLAERVQDDRFAWDSYRRFIQGFGAIVMGVESRDFEAIIGRQKDRIGKKLDPDLTAAEWETIAADFTDLIKAETGREFPEDPYDQLFQAIEAVFESWYGKRAVDYRDFHSLPHDWGTAVNVQAMVFGNMGEGSGTGVAFTRDPNTGERRLFGEYLLNAQGEDVVAGVRTPLPIDTLHDELPEVYDLFHDYATKLEQHYREMQDLEFTIENGKLYLLQTRSGKRSPAAAVRIALDMFEEGTIDAKTAVARVEPEQVECASARSDRSDDQHRSSSEGIERIARRCRGKGGIHGRRSRRTRARRRGCDTGSAGDIARRFPRHVPVPRHRHNHAAGLQATRRSLPASWDCRRSWVRKR